MTLSIIAALFAGYVLGSIPFGLVLTKLAGTADIRGIGSGNIGATNVLRTGRKGLAAATLLGDILKGTAAVLVGAVLWGRMPALAAGFGAFVGHLFPLWLRFKGGKGVATYVGVLLALSWQASLIFGAAWVAVAAITRYSSLSGLTSAIAALVYLWWREDRDVALLFCALTVAIFVTHRANIARLIEGREPKIGQSPPEPES